MGADCPSPFGSSRLFDLSSVTSISSSCSTFLCFTSSFVVVNAATVSPSNDRIELKELSVLFSCLKSPFSCSILGLLFIGVSEEYFLSSRSVRNRGILEFPFPAPLIVMGVSTRRVMVKRCGVSLLSNIFYNLIYISATMAKIPEIEGKK